MRERSAAIVLFLALGGCDDPAERGDDGGADGGDAGSVVDASVHLPVAPAPPALPALGPCPSGWRAVVDDETAPGLVRCDPWPATGRADCGDDEAQFVGGGGCETVGTPCGEGDWAVDLPEDDDVVVYAKAGAAGGDGRRDTPYGDLQSAIDAAIALGNGIVALSKGTFDGHVRMTRPVTLWGACTAETILTRTERPDEYLTIVEIAVRGPSTIRNLTVSGAQLGIDVYDLDGVLVLDSVIVRVKNAGLFVRNAEVDATNLVVRDTMASDFGDGGLGLSVLEAGRITLTRGVVSGNRSTAVTAYDEGTELVVRDTALLDTLPELLSGIGGSAVEARLGAHVVLERVAIQGAQSGGIVSLEEGSLIEATDATIVDVRPAEGYGGHGVVVGTGARFVGRRIEVDASTLVGIAFDGEGTTGTLEDVVITDTQLGGQPQPLADGLGLGVNLGAVVEAHRLLLARNVDSAIGVVGEGSVLVAEDVTALDTSEGPGPSGTALGVSLGGRAEVTRFHSARSVGASIISFGALALTDALVETTAEGPSLSDGWGLGVSGPGEVELERAIFRDHHGLGLVAYEDGRLTGREVLVQDIHEASRAASGVVTIAGGALELTGFVISGADVCGVQVAEGGETDLHDGEVRDNPIGANVQDGAFDLTRIQDGVLYLDNGTPLDSSRLPVPDLGSGL